jgi:hypothetical protein
LVAAGFSLRDFQTLDMYCPTKSGNQMVIKEKKHRLQAQYYRGETSVAYTLCLKERKEIFVHPEIVDVFTDHLLAVIHNLIIIPVIALSRPSAYYSHRDKQSC